MADISKLTLPNNVTYNLKDANAIKEPATDGTNGQVLITDGNGGRSWGTIEGCDVIDNLTSTSTTSALSANQGKVLNDKFTQLKQDISYVEDTDTAVHAISSGYFVIWKGSIAVATSNISIGDTLSNSNLQLLDEGVANKIQSNIDALDPYFVRTRSATGVTTVNNSYIYGVYLFNGSSVTGLPDSSNWWRFVGMGTCQIASLYSSSALQRTYIRSYQNNVWASWTDMNNQIGTLKNGTFDTTSVATTTNTYVASIELPANSIWIVTGGYDYTTSFTQAATTWIAYGTDNAVVTGSIVRSTGANGGGFNVNTIVSCGVSSGMTVKLAVHQSSGSTRTIKNYRFSAVRIK